MGGSSWTALEEEQEGEGGRGREGCRWCSRRCRHRRRRQRHRTCTVPAPCVDRACTTRGSYLHRTCFCRRRHLPHRRHRQLFLSLSSSSPSSSLFASRVRWERTFRFQPPQHKSRFTYFPGAHYNCTHRRVRQRSCTVLHLSIRISHRREGEVHGRRCRA